MPNFKTLSAQAIPTALEKAERYRLLNQPWAAESICLDILAVDAGHQKALRTLVLARTDQFGPESARQLSRAREALSRLTNGYERAYYAGIICERRGKAEIEKHTPGSGHAAYEWISQAMGHFEEAESLRAAGNDDAILRWNSCVRLLAESPHVVPRGEEGFEPVIGE